LLKKKEKKDSSEKSKKEEEIKGGSRGEVENAIHTRDKKN